jgi:PilZ domain-containing protein
MALPPNERRRHPRRKPLQLVYLEFGRENGGMVKDVSEGGMRFHVMGPVAVGHSTSFGVTIDAERRIEGQALMAWTDASGKSGGMAFSELSTEASETLRSWLAEIDAAQHAPEVETADTTTASVETPNPVTDPAASPISSETPAATNAAKVFPSVAEEVLPMRPGSLPAAAPPQSPALVAAIAEVETTTRVPVRESYAPSVVQPVAPAAEKPAWGIPMNLPGRTSAAKTVVTEPVSREEWQEAAREEITPGRRKVPGMSGKRSSSSFGEHEHSKSSSASLEVARFAAIAEQVDPAGIFLKPAVVNGSAKSNAPANDIAMANVAPAKVAQGQDPMRDFLRHPLGVALGNDASQEAPAELLDAPRDTSSRKSRLGIILAAAVVAAVLGFTAVAYRQSVGELLIRLGEKISGESRGRVGSALPGAAQNFSTNGVRQAPVTPVQQVDATNRRLQPAQANRPAASSTAPSSNENPNGGAGNGASNALGSGALTQERPPLPHAPTAQRELAAEREIVPGKPRPLARDVDALWLDVENGNTAAEIELANRYASGEGVQRNCDQARVLLQAAAKRGNEAAAKRLAELPAAGCQ